MTEQECKLCELHRMSTFNKISGCGNVNAELMFVGESPNESEDFRNNCSFNNVNQLLTSILERIGIDRDECCQTFVVKCRPPRNRTPRVKEIRACLPYLEEEIQNVKPKVIVALGGTALYALTGKTGITLYRGIAEFYPKYNTTILPTFHPSSLFSNWKNISLIIEDLKKARDISNGILMPKKSYAKYTMLTSVDAIQKLADKLIANRKFSFDLETTGLNLLKDDILYISLSYNNNIGFAIPFFTLPDEDKEKILIILKRLLESDCLKVGQELKFDGGMMRGRHNIELKGPLFDTCLAHHILNENLPHNKDFLCTQYTDMGLFSDEVEDKSNMKNEDVKTIALYSAKDADFPLRLEEKFRRALERNAGLNFVYNNVSLPLINLVIEAEVVGVPISLDKLHDLIITMPDEIKKLKQEICEIAGEEFNPNSTKQLRHILFTKLGINPIFKTDTDENSTAEDSLTRIPHPIAEKVLQYRTMTGFRSKYLDGKDGKTGMLRYIEEDERVHPKYLIHGTVSGRLSATDPPIQTIPIDPINIRNLFTAPDGYSIVGADFERIELWVLAILSGDKNLLRDLKQGDFHSIAGKKVLGVQGRELTTAERRIAKGISFGTVYGGGGSTLARKADIDIGIAKQYVENFSKVYPDTKAWSKETVRLLYRNGSLTNAFGRKRRFPFIDLAPRDVSSFMKRQGVNWKVQSPASDVAHLANIRIFERFKAYPRDIRPVMILFLHDGVFILCRDDMIEDVKNILIEEMTKPVSQLNNFSFKISLKVGSSWGAAS